MEEKGSEGGGKFRIFMSEDKYFFNFIIYYGTKNQVNHMSQFIM